MSSRAVITIDEIRDSLKRSGYLLEARVENQLQKQGYLAEANSAYTDPDSGKTRELDISAIRGRKAGPEAFDWLFPVVIVECVNNPQPLAFITKAPILGGLHSEQVRYSGLPVKIRDFGRRDAWTSLGDYLGIEKFHHYCKGRVATQFCSFSKKRGSDDWMASHEDAHFSAFATLCHALEHAIDEHYQSWRLGRKEWINVQVYYPMLVVQGELLDIRQKGTVVAIRKATHIAFRRTVVRDGRQTTYQIDVTTERHLPRLLRLVDDEVARMCRLLQRRRKLVRRTVDYLARRLSRLRSAAKVREELEL